MEICRFQLPRLPRDECENRKDSVCLFVFPWQLSLTSPADSCRPVSQCVCLWQWQNASFPWSIDQVMIETSCPLCPAPVSTVSLFHYSPSPTFLSLILMEKLIKKRFLYHTLTEGPTIEDPDCCAGFFPASSSVKSIQDFKPHWSNPSFSNSQMCDRRRGLTAGQG